MCLLNFFKKGCGAVVKEEQVVDKDGKPINEMSAEQILEQIENNHRSNEDRIENIFNYKGLFLQIQDLKGSGRLMYEIKSTTNRIVWSELYDETKQGDLRNVVGKILKRADTQL
jgi:hypothetical protein